MTSNLHIIKQQSIEIEFEDFNDAMGVQNSIAEVFYENLQPRMEVLFDELFGKNYHVSIDKLEIDCGFLNKKNWEQEFTEQAIRKLKEQLVQVNKKGIDFKKIEEATAAETFFFFLENGHLPWNKRISTIADLEQLLVVNEKLMLQLKKLIIQQAKVAERLTYQFSKEFTSKIIAAFTKDKKNALNEILSLLEKLNSLEIDKHIIDAAFLEAFASGERETIIPQFFTLICSKVKEDIKPAAKEIIQQVVDLKKTSHTAEKENKQKQPPKDESKKPTEAIYINNAGLVLLHPFFQKFFEYLKFTKENIWLDEALQHKAVLVLKFLTTGNEEFEEFNLMLNKILCGINIDETVAIDQQLEDEIKNECEALLKNVITHWSVLKNTSIDGLREAFLQRNGKLSKVDNGWLLQVEQKAIDVLFGHLPWGIGLIKLPWMNEMLFTEWV